MILSRIKRENIIGTKENVHDLNVEYKSLILLKAYKQNMIKEKVIIIKTHNIVPLSSHFDSKSCMQCFL